MNSVGISFDFLNIPLTITIARKKSKTVFNGTTLKTNLAGYQGKKNICVKLFLKKQLQRIEIYTPEISCMYFLSFE